MLRTSFAPIHKRRVLLGQGGGIGRANPLNLDLLCWLLQGGGGQFERSVELRKTVTDPFFLEMDGYASLGGTTGILGTSPRSRFAPLVS
jgi:hypothetical protein